MENSRNNLRNFDKKTWFYQSTFTLIFQLLYNANINWHFRARTIAKLYVSLWISSHHSMANFNFVSSSDGGARSHLPFTKLYDVVAMFITHRVSEKQIWIFKYLRESGDEKFTEPVQITSKCSKSKSKSHYFLCWDKIVFLFFYLYKYRIAH